MAGMQAWHPLYNQNLHGGGPFRWVPQERAVSEDRWRDDLGFHMGEYRYVPESENTFRHGGDVNDIPGQGGLLLELPNIGNFVVHNPNQYWQLMQDLFRLHRRGSG